MRVLVLDTYYPAFLAAHYEGHPGLGGRAYEEQLDTLIARRFGTSDAYSYHLHRLGHEAVEIVANCEPLQTAWARERGTSRLQRALRRLVPGRLGAIPRRGLLRAIALAQIQDYEPDVVYLQDLWFFGRRAVESIREQGPLVAGQINSALPPERVLRSLDLITTALPQFVDRFRRLGIASEYLRIAFYERVLHCLERSEDSRADRDYRIVFVGGLSPNLYAGGTRLLERVAAEFPIDVWGYGTEDLPSGSPILRRYRSEAWGLDMYSVLARSRIVLNRHGEVAGGFAANMRMFEATGVGTLLFTESAPNLPDLFEPGREVVAYESETDVVEKLEYYLEHMDERDRIAAAGQARTLSEHTYADRIADLERILQAYVR